MFDSKGCNLKILFTSCILGVHHFKRHNWLCWPYQWYNLLHHRSDVTYLCVHIVWERILLCYSFRLSQKSLNMPEQPHTLGSLLMFNVMSAGYQVRAITPHCTRSPSWVTCILFLTSLPSAVCCLSEGFLLCISHSWYMKTHHTNISNGLFPTAGISV